MQNTGEGDWPVFCAGFNSAPRQAENNIMELQNLTNVMSMLSSAGLYRAPAENNQVALFTQAMTQANAKQALSVIKASSREDSPNSVTQNLREKLTSYFEGVLSGEVQTNGPTDFEPTPELEGLVERVIGGSLPYSEKQSFISQTVREFAQTEPKAQAAYLKSAAERLVQAEIDNPQEEEALPSQVNRLREFYQGLVSTLQSASQMGLGGLNSSLLDIFA